MECKTFTQPHWAPGVRSDDDCDGSPRLVMQYQRDDHPVALNGFEKKLPTTDRPSELQSLAGGFDPCATDSPQLYCSADQWPRMLASVL